MKSKNGLCSSLRGEILEKDVSPATARSGSPDRRSSRPTHGDQQEPAESQRHVHVPQQGLTRKMRRVEQRLAHHLSHAAPKVRARRQSEQNLLFVGAGQAVEPRPPLPGQDGEHHRSADDERQTEWRVESHRQKSPQFTFDKHHHAARIDAARAHQPAFAAQHALVHLLVGPWYRRGAPACGPCGN